MEPELRPTSFPRVEKNRQHPKFSLEEADLSIAWFSGEIHAPYVGGHSFSDLPKTVDNLVIPALFDEKF